MLAARIYAPNDMRLEEVPIPGVPEGSIRVKVAACSVCGTDLRIYTRGDYRAQFPVTPGHEIAGVVDAVAPGVTGVREGDRVCVAPGHGCGKCRMCRAGHPNVCTAPFPSVGYKIDGGFAEYMSIPRNVFEMGFVNPIPEELTFRQASMSEIVACCLNAQRGAPVRAGDNVLILGCGPAGIIHAQLARLKGARRVIVAQRSPERLRLAASRFPIDRTVAMCEESLEDAVAQETGGEGADVVYVCAPSHEAQEQAIRLAGPHGRVNFFGGLPKDNCITQVDANIVHYKELFLSGASSSLPETNREALRLLAERKIDADKLITDALPLRRVTEAFAVAQSKRGIKVTVDC